LFFGYKAIMNISSKGILPPAGNIYRERYLYSPFLHTMLYGKW